jgi:hypothetical protein
LPADEMPGFRLIYQGDAYAALAYQEQAKPTRLHPVLCTLYQAVLRRLVPGPSSTKDETTSDNQES